MLLSGSIKYAPGKVFPSKFEGKPAQRSVTISHSGGQNADCWFEVGSDLEFLKKEDTVFFTLKNGSKAEIHLTEDLAAALASRRAASMPAPSVAAAPPISPPPSSSAPLPPPSKPKAPDAEEMVEIFAQIYAALPQASEGAIVQLAIAVFQRRAEF